MAIRKIVSRSIGVDVIAAEDLAANSVTVSEISDGAVTVDKLGTGAVTADKVESNIALPGTTATINGLTPQASNMAGTNAIINGNMAIWQRGTTFTAGGYTADRFNWTGSSVATVSQQTHVLGDNPIAGDSSSYFMRLTTTSDALNNELLHRLEDVRSFAGTTVTVSFWAKTNNGTEGFNFKLYQNFGTGGSPSALTSASDTSIYIPTTSWQRYSFVCDIPSVAGKTIGTNNNSFLWVQLAQIRSSNVGFSLDITGVQLEAGSTASPFAHENYADTLRKCRRYLPAYNGLNTFGACTTYTTNTGWCPILFDTPTRVAPTSISISSAAHFNVINAGAPSAITIQSLGLGTNGAILVPTVAGISGTNIFYSTSDHAQILFNGCEL